MKGDGRECGLRKVQARRFTYVAIMVTGSPKVAGMHGPRAAPGQTEPEAEEISGKGRLQIGELQMIQIIYLIERQVNEKD